MVAEVGRRRERRKRRRRRDGWGEGRRVAGKAEYAQNEARRKRMVQERPGKERKKGLKEETKVG